jgi:predicted PurR-regulated permease PerM
LHPIIILIALAFWGVLWGVVGMILSVPLISLIKIISQHLDHPYAK